MRRALFFCCFLFCAAFCFAQHNSNFRIIGKIPDAGDQRLYQIQVGAFLLCQNAEEAFERLNGASFNPAYESFSGLIRVVINRLPAGDVPSYLTKIQNTGFTEVIVRIDTGRAASQTPICTAACSPSTCTAACGSSGCSAAAPPPALEETGETAEEAPAPFVPAPEVTRARETAPPQSLPPLPAPGDRYPEDGYRIGEEALQRQRHIDFRWGAVEGATSYILTIYRETPQGRSQIFITEPLEQTHFDFHHLELLENTGTYIWRVEALSHRQRGQPGENTYTLDVPRPGQVNTKHTGELYGTH